MSADPRQAIHETVSVRRGLRRLVLHLWTIGFRILRHVIASRGFYETAGGSTFKEVREPGLTRRSTPFA